MALLFLRVRPPPSTTRSATLFPYAALCRSPSADLERVGGALGGRLPSRVVVGSDDEGADRFGYDHMAHEGRAAGDPNGDAQAFMERQPVDRKSTRLNSSH